MLLAHTDIFVAPIAFAIPVASSPTGPQPVLCCTINTMLI